MNHRQAASEMSPPRKPVPHASAETFPAVVSSLISGRKAFQKPMVEGVVLLNAIQDVYLNNAVTVA